ncbi:putative HTH-type transcriptional regulator YvdT [Streptomyces sp. ADI96-02]|uniref:TetR/AcrR family transcriptional regulator n=1 Tax=unclassified Streptomyces TaxID=2593676 RepID=UPI000F54D8AE|nr:TetR/AcrR family transcriptional regulator [Streptomyces sp. ADI96-02]RPK67253.1 putative HTH-type transcriptional regulator YvdT [Streptomyces sp. ADI96-02]
MATDAGRQLRADAARNSERILKAAREVYAEIGPDAMLEDIAHRAGVGIATLYRRFSNKETLVKAALKQSMAEQLSPAIERALGDEDPWRGLVTLLESTLSLVARERDIVAAANDAGALTAEVTAPYTDAQVLLVRRGQAAGVIRADLVPADMEKITGMLISVLWNMAPETEGWRRYIVLILDSLRPAGASPLPPPPAPLPQRDEGTYDHPPGGLVTREGRAAEAEAEPKPQAEHRGC